MRSYLWRTVVVVTAALAIGLALCGEAAAATPADTLSGPDLSPTALSGPSSLNLAPGGADITVYWTDSNLGDQAAWNYRDAIFLSTSPDPSIVADRIVGTTVPNVGYETLYLGPGGSQGYYQDIGIPGGLADGVYYIDVVDDWGQVVGETNETNNVRSIPVTIAQVRADLSPSSVSGPSSLNLAPGGADITVSWTDNNLGTADANGYRDAVFLSTSPDPSIVADRIVGTTLPNVGYESLGLGAGQSTSRSTDFGVPGGLSSGVYYIDVVDDSGQVVSESDETNNTASVPIRINQIGADLAPSELSAPGSVNVPQDGTSIPVAWIDSNLGDAAANQYRDAVYLSTSPDPSIVADRVLGTSLPNVGYESLSLAAGDSQAESTDLGIPAWVPSGSYYLDVVDDSSQVVTETNENNNTSSTPITIKEVRADLAPSELSAPSSVTVSRAGTSITVSWTDANLGDAAANQYHDAVYLSTSPDPSVVADRVLGTTAPNVGYESFGLDAGDAQTRSVDLGLPSSLTSGVYYLDVVDDSSNVVTETNEKNNTTWTTVKIRVTPAPPTGLNVDGSNSSGTNGPIAITGQGEPGDTVQVYASCTGPSGTQGPLQLSTGTITVDDSGNWSLSGPAAQLGLSDCQWTFWATESWNGLTSDPSTRTQAFTVDTTPPAISIEGGYANGGFAATGGTPQVTISDPTDGEGNPGSGVNGSATTYTLDGRPYTTGAPITDLGPHTLVVSACDNAGNCTTTTSKFTVFGYAAGGNFVIGDLTAGNPVNTGSSVTFWGAQWEKNDQLSGGSSPAQFKGFEDDPAKPACGTSWTTDPGNSTPPPGSVPSYMAVIVSSGIGSSGSTISGDTPHIVIVKTDSGYAGNPGHAGTGTILGEVC